MIHDGYSISFFCFCQMLSIFGDPGSPDHTFDTVGFLQSCDRHSWGNSNPLGAWGAHRAPRWSGASLEAQQHPTLLGSAWRHHSGGTCRFSVDKSVDFSCFVVLTYVYFQWGTSKMGGNYTTRNHPNTFLNSSHGYHGLPSKTRHLVLRANWRSPHALQFQSPGLILKFLPGRSLQTRWVFQLTWHLHKSAQRYLELPGYVS